MKYLVLLLAMFAVGCGVSVEGSPLGYKKAENPGPPAVEVERHIDSDAGVVCYVVRKSGSIFCVR